MSRGFKTTADWLDGFQEWIQQKFRIESFQSWANIILFFSQDERDALDKFFELLEEFRQKNSERQLIERG